MLTTGHLLWRKSIFQPNPTQKKFNFSLIFIFQKTIKDGLTHFNIFWEPWCHFDEPPTGNLLKQRIKTQILCWLGCLHLLTFCYVNTAAQLQQSKNMFQPNLIQKRSDFNVNHAHLQSRLRKHILFITKITGKRRNHYRSPATEQEQFPTKPHSEKVKF